jgi:hypothetical protein
MIAYNKTGLDNRKIREEAAKALGAGCITEEENAVIHQRHPAVFYSPNIFIRVGLFLLTGVIVAFSLGLLALIADRALGPLMIFMGFAGYGVLEYLIYSKRHFQSGVDDALLWMAGTLIYSGICVSADSMPLVTLYFIIFCLGLYGSLRYADRMVTLIAYGALLTIVFRLGIQGGAVGKAILPFLVMAVGGVFFLSGKKLARLKSCRHYHSCLLLIQVISLIVVYAAGNYYVVRELNALISDRPIDDGSTIALGWLFWILTVVTPLLYIYRGIRKKDALFLWVGIVLTGAMIFTIRYYYHVLPAELAMTIGGTALISIAYLLIRYLRTPRHGFTYAATDDRHLLQDLHLESLVIAETFAPTPSPADTDFRFGGGSGGGGGAGGQY